jgi:[glutamine synthetase] adenylyltransferase / [glutamine synthetase]-adenylyl-L-tyrosine phosphorylase
MAKAGSRSLSELARLGFESLSEAVPKLRELSELSGVSEDSLLTALTESASPDRALEAALELSRSQPKSFRDIATNQKALVRFSIVCGASDGLASFLQRSPKSLALFTLPTSLPRPEQLTNLSTESITALRISYREQLLRIADFDLAQSGYEHIIQVTTALSDLAAGAIEGSLAIARQQLVSEGRHSVESINSTKLAIIAMGKCGARELNYLSDVDVIYVANGEAEDYLEVATKLATKLAKIIDEPEAEPGLWQVDPNLRPEGKQGALVRSLDAHIGYYQRWAESWEFQALLKARFIAGDAELGAAYIAAIKPLIWSKPDRSSIVESARHLRKRVLELIPAEHRDLEIKLGRGGLRDVEFTAQLMQLVHGTADESLRVMSTFEALDALAAAGLLSRADRDVFVASYQFVRSMEHRVQLGKLRRTHLIPTDPSELRRVARGLGLTSEELLTKWASTRAQVARLHDSVFYRPLLQATAALEAGEVALTDAEVVARLQALGFTDPAGASQHILALTSGVSRRATIQRTLLPVLIRWMAEGTNPDRALLSFRRLSESLGETHWFLGMLRDSSGAAERLMKVLSTSALVSRLLESIPDSSEWFGDEAALQPVSTELIEQEMLAIIDRRGGGEDELLRNIRRREYLRVAIGAVLGALSLEDISTGLTSITEAYLRSMLQLAKQNLDLELDLCIIAMGRLGGSELGFGSDADAMLLFSSDSPSGQADADRLASELLVLVKDSLLEFDLDLGLRPEGKNGPRIRSLNGYAGYYEKWADTWEFQALLRARPISGSDELQSSFLALIDPLRYPEQLKPTALTEIRRIKARVESERLPQGADPARHLKLGRGSLSDVEWVSQLYQLQHAWRHEGLRTTQTLAALKEIGNLGLAGKTQVEELRQAWLLAARCRSALVLAVDKLLDTLPTDRKALDAVARILEYSPGQAGQLEETYLSTTRKSRSAFEKLFLS